MLVTCSYGLQVASGDKSASGRQTLPHAERGDLKDVIPDFFVQCQSCTTADGTVNKQLLNALFESIFEYVEHFVGREVYALFQVRDYTLLYIKAVLP